MTNPLDTAPLLSVVTVNRNMAEGLERTIASVTQQDFASFEYVVVDGASTDDSIDVINRNSGRVDRWVSGRDAGIYDAMNKGVLLARGEWVLFLNSGDIFASSHALSAVMAAAQPGDDILYGDAVVQYPGGAKRVFVAFEPTELPYGMICSHQALFARRALLADHPFTVGKIRSDYEFLLRCRAEGRAFHRLPIVIAEIEAGGLSDIKRIAVLRETAVLLRREGLFGPRAILRFGFLFAWTVVGQLVKPLLPRAILDAVRRYKMAIFGARSALS
jgi:putative colanic acid biosynthesis glycosyltransferase